MKGKIVIFAAIALLLLAGGCQNNSSQEAPNLSMPEKAWVFVSQSQGNTGYEVNGTENIEVLWQALAIDRWQGSDMENMDNDADAIILDYDTPFTTRITLNNKDQVELYSNDDSILWYKAPSGSYKDLAAALDGLVETSQEVTEVTLDEEDVGSIIQEIIADETLKANDGETNNIDCSATEVKDELTTALTGAEWQEVGNEDMPTESPAIALFFTESGNSLLIEEDDTGTYLTLSYHGRLFNYYKTEGDILSPISELLETIK